jgi:lipopolysaccharide assembly protein A
MRFLKVMFWLLLGGLVAAFVIYNGDERVTLHLWGGLIADFSLPFLMIVIFLAGFVPMLIAYHTMRWRMRQRLTGLERALADLRAVAAAPPPAPAPVPDAPPAAVPGEELPLLPQQDVKPAEDKQ